MVVTPAYQNPTGICLSTARLHGLAELARIGRVLVIEDLALIDMRLEGSAPGTVAALTPDGNVVSAGSMSKLFWGGLHVGWLRVPKRMMNKLSQLRAACDLGLTIDAQAQAAWLLQHREEVLQDRIPVVREQRTMMAEALNELLPDSLDHAQRWFIVLAEAPRTRVPGSVPNGTTRRSRPIAERRVRHS